jgi:hypothetical protein
MKKTLILSGMVFVVYISMTAVCWAGGNGPVEPLGTAKFALSGEYNNVLDMDLKKNGDVTGGEVEESYQGYAKLAVGISDNVNLYARLGAANLKEKLKWSNNTSHTIKYDNGLLWGIGGNGIYDLGNNFGIGGNLQIDAWFVDADSISGDNSPTFVDKGSLNNSEFQASLYLKYTCDLGVKITPYAGGYYSYFDSRIDKTLKYQDTNGTIYTCGDIKNDDNFGVLLGLDVTATDKITLNIEGRFIAETAVTCGVCYKF